MLMRSRNQRGDRSEVGSVAMATLLMIFAAMLGVVAVGRSVAHLRDSVDDGDRASASAGAELGIAEAIALIEQGASASFDGKVGTPSVTAAYEATSIDANTWDIYSYGTTGDATQARLVRIERAAKVEPEPEAQLALFADRSLQLHSSNKGTIDGGIGSNGQITIGSTKMADAVTLYKPDASCTDCSDVVAADGPRVDTNPVIPTSGTQTCPKEIKFDSTIDGKNGQPYLCMSGEKFEMPETLKVINPPLIIHIGAGVEIDMENSSINSSGSAEDFMLLIHKPTGWKPAELKAQNAKFNGLLYAPGRSFSAKNFQGNGVFVFGQFRQSESGTISITHDPALDAVLGGDGDDDGSDGADNSWFIADWQKVAPRS